MSGARIALGRWGEDLAAQHLVATGAVLLDRNWRCREGELDLVAREPDGTVVFCEVKTRSGTGFGEPAEAVGPVKARRIRALAVRWLQEHPPDGRPPGAAVRRRQRRPGARAGSAGRAPEGCVLSRRGAGSPP